MKNFLHLFPILLTPKQRNGFSSLLLLILIGSLFELMGIGLILPVIMSIVDPDFLGKYPEVGVYVSKIAEPTYTNVVILSISSLLAFYVIKSSYLVFLAIKQGQFVYSVKEEVGKKLFAGYIFKPYSFYLLKNSSELIRNLTSEVANVGVVIRASMVLLVDGVVLFAVVALLFYVEPMGTLTILSIVGFSALGFQYFTKDKLLEKGKSRQYNDGKRIQHIQQGLSSVKDVKILSVEKQFINWFNHHNSEGVKAERFQYILASMPRLFLEFVVVVGLAILIFSLVFDDKQVNSISMILGVYAVAIFRLLPSINRILSATQQIRFCFPSVNVVATELMLVDEDKLSQKEEIISENKSEKLKLEVKITAKGISFMHEGTSNLILKDINLDIVKGGFIGIVGGSGAGKSTLIDILLGLLDPTEGSVLVDDEEISKNISKWQKNIGYVSQHIYLVDDSIRQNIAFGVHEADISNPDVDRAINSAQLRELIDELPEGIETEIGERGVRLSGGQRQRVGIARALYHNPNILILDEATSSLDQYTESEIMRTIERLHGHKTIILVSHRIQTLSNCDKIYQIESGVLVGERSYEQLITELKE